METKLLVESVLAQDVEREAAQLAVVTVRKQVPLELDLGLLTATDPNVISLNKCEPNDNIDEKESSEPKALSKLTLDEYMAANARDNVQLVLNALWDLETSRVDGLVVAKLPKPTTVLPRSHPPPRPKPPTKWETFAKQKGIVPKGKKAKKVFDEARGEWVPTYGYKHAAAERDANWCIPIPDNNKDPNADMFAKVADEKKEKVAKNEFQRLRNIARSQKAVMGVPPVAPERPELSKEEASVAATYARTSTASVGVFDRTLKGEKPAKNMGKKRQFEANFQSGTLEKDKNLQIIDQIMSKTPKVDIEKAVDSLLTKRGNSVKINDSKSGGEGANKSARRSQSGVNRRGRPQGKFAGGRGDGEKSMGKFSRGRGGGGRGGGRGASSGRPTGRMGAGSAARGRGGGRGRGRGGGRGGGSR